MKPKNNSKAIKKPSVIKEAGKLGTKTKLIKDSEKLVLKPETIKDEAKLEKKSNTKQSQKTESSNYNWENSLKGSGYEVVSVIDKNGFIYTGSNGFIYKLDANGNTLKTNNLPGRGNYEIRLAITDTHLVVGTYGFVVLVPLNDFGNTDKNINVSLPEGGYNNVSVLVAYNAIYAGTNGRVYHINSQGKVISRNDIPGVGNTPEVSLAITGTFLVAGVNGYAVLIYLLDFSNSSKNIKLSLPGCGYNITSVIVQGNYIYAGCSGYVYKIQTDGKYIGVNNLPGRGNEEIRLSSTDSHVVVGTNGFVVLVSIQDFLKTDKNINTSLPNSGYTIVSVLYDGNKTIYAGSSGQAYALESENGIIYMHNTLPGLDYKEIRIATNGKQFYIGTNGFVASLKMQERDMLDTFDHVVVLMLENRSFDNLLGYMYPKGVPADAPLGKTFEGVAGKNYYNPVPKDAVNQPPDGSGKVYIKPISGKLEQDYFTPYPDPGEEYPHVNTQLFNVINGEDKPPYNLPPSTVPKVPSDNLGFVKDYIENFKRNEEKREPTFEEYKQIMECFTPEAVPVLSTLAREFGVFDHWFCSVPSQTWCNRAFWNAGTSWGHVNNGGSISGLYNAENSASWIKDSKGDTLFNQLESSGGNSPLNWMVYSSNLASLTGLIHLEALEDYHIIPDHFPSLDKFFTDCKDGKLTSYSFVEPNFWTPHNDMHPSTYDSKHYGKGSTGSVLLGEKLVWDVYEAIKNSASVDGNNAQNTLLVITFDEHGGCWDHVSPQKAVGPDLSKYTKWEGFDFSRSGVRVPTIMVSPHIAKNTVVNEPMDHTSFINTMQEKWNRIVKGQFPPLSTRSANAPKFTPVFTSEKARPISDWPTIPEPKIPEEMSVIDFSKAPLNDLQQSILAGVIAVQNSKKNKRTAKIDASNIKTVKEAMDYLRKVKGIPGSE